MKSIFDAIFIFILTLSTLGRVLQYDSDSMSEKHERGFSEPPSNKIFTKSPIFGVNGRILN